MANKEKNIKNLISEYLLEEGLLREKVKDPRFEFGFRFIFPKAKDASGREIGRNMLVIKPNKKELIEISCATQISPIHIKALNSLKNNEKQQFYRELKKILFLQDMFFNIDMKNNRYVIIDNIFLESDNVLSKNEFFKSIRKIYSCTMHSIILLEEFTNTISFDTDDLQPLP